MRDDTEGAGDRPVGIIGAGRLGTSLADGLPGQVITRADLGTAPPREWAALVDCSHPSALPDVLAVVRTARCPLLYATTNTDESCDARLRELGVPVVRARNLSVGNWYQRMALRQILADVRRAERIVEVTVLDRHPGTKSNKASGTAVALAEVVTQCGIQPEIFWSRYGVPVADHSVHISLGRGESLTIRHSVNDYSAAVAGARRALDFLRSATPGLYEMDDVFMAAVLTASGPERGSPE